MLIAARNFVRCLFAIHAHLCWTFRSRYSYFLSVLAESRLPTNRLSPRGISQLHKQSCGRINALWRHLTTAPSSCGVTFRDVRPWSTRACATWSDFQILGACLGSFSALRASLLTSNTSSWRFFCALSDEHPPEAAELRNFAKFSFLNFWKL